MDACAFDIQHRAAAVKAKVDRQPRLKPCVCERAMHQLAVADHHVAGLTDQRNCISKPLAASLFNHRLDIDLAEFVRSGNRPDPIDRCAAVDLRHKVETMYAFIKGFMGPVRVAILMP